MNERSLPSPRRIDVEYIGVLGEHRASFRDDDGEGPYGTGKTEAEAIEDLYLEADECPPDCRCCQEELLGVRGISSAPEV